MKHLVERQIWSVTDLVKYLYQSLDNDEVLKRVWLEAEISNFSQNNKSKHMYLTLKDNYAKVKAAMFAGNNRRLRFSPKDGDQVLVRGYLSVYDREGQVQFYIQDMRLSGAGDLYVAFEELKNKLLLEGLFHSPKQSIPAFSKSVGVITSRNGAALHDVVTTMKRRFPMTSILVCPVSVQGEQAAFEISEAIKLMNLYGEVDVLIVGRGGGSIEEIWAFNEEVVARSIFRSRTPVISAVGHETDMTISDMVADLRAATPTAAAEMVSPHQQELKERIYRLKERLIQAQSLKISNIKNTLKHLTGRPVFQQPSVRLVQYSQRLDELTTSLHLGIQNYFEKINQQMRQTCLQLGYYNPSRRVSSLRERVKVLLYNNQYHTKNYFQHMRQRVINSIGKLDALSPLKVLKRGYSVLYHDKDNKLITSKNQVHTDGIVCIRLSDGRLRCKVLKLED